MAVGLFTQNKMFDKHNVFCGRLIMHENTTTADSLCRVCSHIVMKWTDKNHACKNFKKALYELKLSNRWIEYLYFLFVAALDNFKGKMGDLRTALTEIVLHCCNDHSLCNWHEHKDNYVHENLPNQNPLDNFQIKTALNEVFLKYISNADKLASAAST